MADFESSSIDDKNKEEDAIVVGNEWVPKWWWMKAIQREWLRLGWALTARPWWHTALELKMWRQGIKLKGILK